MRPIASILLALLLLQSAGPMFLLQLQQKQVRREMKRLIRAGLPEEKLRRFEFVAHDRLLGGERVEWIEPHEFRYRGVMYDIARTEHEDGPTVHGRTVHGTTVHYCVRDDAETALYTQLDRLAREETNQNPERRRQSTRLMQQLQLPALVAESYIPNAEITAVRRWDVPPTAHTLRGDFSPPTPPPEA
jgi:hypothetical protein